MVAKILVAAPPDIAARVCRVVSAAGHVPSALGGVDEAEAAASRAEHALVVIAVGNTSDTATRAAAIASIEAARRLRERHDLPSLYLLGDVDEQIFALAKESRPAGYLRASFDDRELDGALDVAIRQHARERSFAATLRSIGDAVITADTSNRVTFANPAALAQLGLGPAEIAGRQVEDLLTFVDAFPDAADTPVPGAGSGALPTPREARLRVAGGARVEVEGTVSPLASEGAPPEGTVLVFRDVSQRKRLANRLATTERLAAIGTMVAGIQHEINNPLATILANLQFVLDLLADRDLDEEMTEAAAALRDASEGADRVKRAMEDLRHFSRADDTARVPVDLVTSIESAARITAHAMRHHAKLERSFAPAPPVLGTEAQLARVFVNLLLSAAAATSDGRDEPHVIVLATMTDEAGRAVAEIRHDGPPLTAEELRLAFDPSTDSLALAICQGIVTSLGGEIAVESSAESGTTFRVLLPPAPKVHASAGHSSPPPTVTRKGRLLVIDDEPAFGTALARLLGREHEVVSETDARAALERVTAEPFDIVFCDLKMPRLGGMEFFAELSARAPEQAARVVFLTGGAFSPRSDLFLRSVKNRCLAKPFSREAVAAILRQMLGRPIPTEP